MNKPQEAFYTKVAVAFVLIFCLGWTIVLTKRYNNFGYYDWDLAFFAQAVWQLAQGSSWSSLFGVNFFANHANFLAVAIAPFYSMFPHPMLLVFLKIVSVAIAGAVIFRIASKKIGSGYALWVLVLFFIYAPNIFGILYEFDMEALAPGILALTYYFYYERRWMLFLLMACAAILIKENMPLVIAMFGVHALFTREERWKWGVVPLLVGVFSFIILVKIFIPSMAGRSMGAEHPYIGTYAHLGSSLGDVLYNVTAHPLITFKKVFHFTDIIWLRDLVGVLIFLPLFAPGVLLLILPVFAQHFLSASSQQHTIYYNYALTMAPFIFLALVSVLGRIYKRTPRVIFSAIALLLITNLVALSAHLPGILRRYGMANDVQWNDARRTMLERIGPRDPVIATFCFLPALANRKELYAFHKVYLRGYNSSGNTFSVPPEVRWMLVDFNDGFYQEALHLDGDFVKARVDAFLKEGRWVEVEHHGPIYLFRRD